MSFENFGRILASLLLSVLQWWCRKMVKTRQPIFLIIREAWLVVMLWSWLFRNLKRFGFVDVKILLSRITSLSIRFFSVYREGSIILVSYKEWAPRTTVTNSVEGMNRGPRFFMLMRSEVSTIFKFEILPLQSSHFSFLMRVFWM